MVCNQRNLPSLRIDPRPAAQAASIAILLSQVLLDWHRYESHLTETADFTTSPSLQIPLSLVCELTEIAAVLIRMIGRFFAAR